MFMGRETLSQEASCRALSHNHPWGDRCRQHLLFHGGWGRARFQRRRRRKKDYRRLQGLLLFLHSAPNLKLSVSTKPQKETEREKWGWGERDGGGKSKKIAKVNGLELEAASATAV